VGSILSDFERRTFSGSEATTVAIAGLSISGANRTLELGMGVIISGVGAVPEVFSSVEEEPSDCFEASRARRLERDS
jgi:hypothetical protein